MKATINIYFGDNPVSKSEKIQITIGRDEESYEMDVYTSVNEDINLVLSNEKLEEAIKNYILCNSVILNEDDTLNEYLNINNVRRDITQCDEIILYGTYQEIMEYLRNNPSLKGKKIVIGSILDLNIESLNEIRSKLDTKEYNFVVQIRGNTRAISLDEYEKTINLIEELTNKLSKYNFSPLEILIYAYDLIRDRVYVKEDVNQEFYESRDLTSVLLGDKIVCIGYVRIFNAILEKLGIRSMDFILEVNDKPESHARSLVYLKDEKYNINGLYFFDPTFDSKTSEDNMSFLNRYLYFAKTYAQLKSFEKDEFIYYSYKYFDTSSVMKLDDNIVNNKMPFYRILYELTNEHINLMLRFIGKRTFGVEELEEKIESIIDTMYEIVEMANRPIDVHVFLKALYEVRKQEYYEQPYKYAFDMQALVRILTNSKMIDNNDQLANLFNAIFGIYQNIDGEQAYKLVSDFLQSNGLDIEMERVRLTRTLRTIYERKMQEGKALK